MKKAKHPDDFAEMAVDPDRRRYAIATMKGKLKRFERGSFVFLLLAFLMAIEGGKTGIMGVVDRIGLLGDVFIIIIFHFSIAQLKSDLHLLQVLDKLEEKPPLQTSRPNN